MMNDKVHLREHGSVLAIGPPTAAQHDCHQPLLAHHQHAGHLTAPIRSIGANPYGNHSRYRAAAVCPANQQHGHTFVDDYPCWGLASAVFCFPGAFTHFYFNFL